MKIRFQVSGFRFQRIRESISLFPGTWHLAPGNSCASRAFTLIETLAAVTLLVVAVVSPMLLAERALTSAYYARDQITASYLAQEAIEAIHQIRDDQILQIAHNTTNASIDLFGHLATYADGQAFIIDATNDQTSSASSCSGPCYLQTDQTTQLYGYKALANPNTDTWMNSPFTRTVKICYVQAPPSTLCTSAQTNEIRVTVTVSWQTSSLQSRQFTMSEDLYRWIADGSSA